MRSSIPNILTIARGILILIIIPLFFIDWTYQFHLLYGLFIVASTTDFFDGYLARKWHVVSDFGKMFDPLMDKLLTIVLFILLAPYDIIPTWVFALFVVRDILVDGMKNFMLSHHIVTPAAFWGKLKFFCIVLLFHAAFLILLFPNILYFSYLLWCSIIIGLFAAFVSGFFYTKKFISFFRTL